MTESSLLSLFQTNTTPKHSEHTFECDGYKECPGCSETKPHSEFGIRDKSKGTIRSRCKSCHTKYLLEWRHKNPDKVKPAVRRSALKFKYGMSVRDYDQRLIEQGGVCRICGLSCDTGNRLAVDHCHTTGKIRGLLCQGCNTGLGKFRDDITILEKAIAYLKANQ